MMNARRICILGVPGRLTDAVVDLCCVASGSSETILDDDGSAATCLGGNAAPPWLIVSHFPGSELVSWLRTSRAVTILVLPDTHLCVAQADMTVQEEHGVLPGMLSRSIASICAARDVPGRLLVTGRNISKELDALEDVLPRPGLQDLTAAREAVISSLYDTSIVMAAKSTLLESRKVCHALLDFARGDPGGEVEWPATLFFDTQTRKRPPRQVVDLTGPARCLCFGPYLHLPAGRWSARIAVEIAGSSGPIEFRAEIYTETGQQNFPAVLSGNGRYEVSIGFVAAEPLLPIQIRLFTDRGEIEGCLGFGGVRLRWEGP
jgi:hypothetical protein